MRDHNKAFVKLIAEAFACTGPVYEFGSYQVEGQVEYADLRALFPGETYVGCDMRSGPGVDRVEDVSEISLDDGAAGTVLCIETFEHVFEVRRAFDEVFRVLRPGGLFIITSPLNFKIHGYPDDYWRMTPSCLRRMLAPYEARLTGFQGHHKFPHSVMGFGFKSPAPIDFSGRVDAFMQAYPKPGSGPFEAVMKLEPSPSLTLNARGPDDRPLAGVEVWMANGYDMWSSPCPTPSSRSPRSTPIVPAKSSSDIPASSSPLK